MDLNDNVPMLMKGTVNPAQLSYKGSLGASIGEGNISNSGSMGMGQQIGPRKAVKAHSILSKLEQTGKLNMSQSPTQMTSQPSISRYSLPNDSLLGNPLPVPPQPSMTQLRDQSSYQAQGQMSTMYGGAKTAQGILMNTQYMSGRMQGPNMNSTSINNSNINSNTGNNRTKVSGRGGVPQQSDVPISVDLLKDPSRNRERIVYMCEVCDAREASVHCSNCGGFFCGSCDAATHASRLLSKHMRIPVSSYTPPPPCPSHPNNPATHFCLTCNSLCCVECVIGHGNTNQADSSSSQVFGDSTHRSHDIIALSETVSLTIKRLSEIASRAREAESLSSTIINSINTKKNMVEQAASEGLEAVQSSFNNLMACLENKTKEIKKLINATKDKQVGDFERKYAAMDDFGGRVREYCGKAEKMTESTRGLGQMFSDRALSSTYASGRAAAIINQVEKLEVLMDSVLDGGATNVMDENMELARIIIEEHVGRSTDGKGVELLTEDALGVISSDNIRHCLNQIDSAKELISRISLE